jgi:hypothetical protein
MKRLVSKNRSTQLTKQLSSPRENRVEGVPVMHLWQKKKVQWSVIWSYGGRKEKEVENALVPAHTCKCVDGLLDTRLRLLPLKESLELFLEA